MTLKKKDDYINSVLKQQVFPLIFLQMALNTNLTIIYYSLKHIYSLIQQRPNNS